MVCPGGGYAPSVWKEACSKVCFLVFWNIDFWICVLGMFGFLELHGFWCFGFFLIFGIPWLLAFWIFVFLVLGICGIWDFCICWCPAALSWRSKARQQAAGLLGRWPSTPRHQTFLTRRESKCARSSEFPSTGEQIQHCWQTLRSHSHSWDKMSKHWGLDFDRLCNLEAWPALRAGQDPRLQYLSKCKSQCLAKLSHLWLWLLSECQQFLISSPVLGNSDSLPKFQKSKVWVVQKKTILEFGLSNWDEPQSVYFQTLDFCFSFCFPRFLELWIFGLLVFWKLIFGICIYRNFWMFRIVGSWSNVWIFGLLELWICLFFWTLDVLDLGVCLFFDFGNGGLSVSLSLSLSLSLSRYYDYYYHYY